MTFRDLIFIGGMIKSELGLRLFFQLILLVCGSAIVELAVVFFVGYAVSVMFGKSAAAAPISVLGELNRNWLLALFLVSLAGTLLLRLATQYQMAKLSFHVSASVAIRLFKGFIGLNPVNLRSNWKSADLMSLLSAKIDTLSYCIILPYISTAGALVTSLLLFFALLINSGILFLGALVFFGAAFMGIRKSLATRADLAGQKIFSLQNEAMSLVQAGIVAILDVKANRRERSLAVGYSERMSELGNNQATANSLAGWGRIFMEFIGIAGLIVLGFNAGGAETKDPAGVLGMLASSAYVLQRLLPTLQLINTNSIAFGSGRTTLNELRKHADQLAIETMSLTPPIVFETIEFRSVDIGYGADSGNVLADVSLRAKANDKVAISGPSGAGKSSLLLALLGFLAPSRGDIIVNGSQPLQNFQHTWLNNIVFVGQDIAIYDGTLAYNMSANEDVNVAQDARFWAVMKTLRLEQVVEDFGLESKVRFGGLNFSGGQRQRVALARALLSTAPILVLDEPTSSLDSEMAHEIINFIVAMKNKSVFIVTHNKEIVRRFDKHWIIQNGTVTTAMP